MPTLDSLAYLVAPLPAVASPFVTLIVVLLLAATLTAFVGAGLLVSRWGLDGPLDLPMEVLARLVPNFTRSRASLRRRFIRALTSPSLLTLDGVRIACDHTVVRVAPEDAPRLVNSGNMPSLAEDAVRTLARHAYRNGWRVDGDLAVTIQIDYTIRPGWVPNAQPAHMAPTDGYTAYLSYDTYLTDIAKPTTLKVFLGPSLRGRSGPGHTTGTTGRARPDRAAPAGFTKVAVTRIADSLAPGTGRYGATRTSNRRSTAVGPVLVLVDQRDIQHRLEGAGVIGRADDAAVKLDSEVVSAHHLRAFSSDMKWWVTDVGSTNGTIVNDLAAISGVDYEIHPGDRLTLGHGGPILRVLRAETAGKYTKVRSQAQ